MFIGEHVKNWNENNEIKSEIEGSYKYTTPSPLPQIRVLKILEFYFLFLIVRIFFLHESAPPLPSTHTLKNDGTCLDYAVRKI